MSTPTCPKCNVNVNLRCLSGGVNLLNDKHQAVAVMKTPLYVCPKCYSWTSGEPIKFEVEKHNDVRPTA